MSMINDRPSFGKLTANEMARNKRGTTKFFDSAEWAMTGQQQQQNNRRNITVVDNTVYFNQNFVCCTSNTSPITH